ncbi:hypothetical protein V2L05_14585 [Pseudomonas alliivorans]|nr:hypothetical protein [Pseudomonas alliivorans]
MSTKPVKTYSFGQTMRLIHLNHSFDVLDEFISQLESAWTHSQKRLAAEYDGLSADRFESENDMEDYRDFLADDYYQLNEVRKLGQALAISGLYAQVELQVKRVLASAFPDMGQDKKNRVLRGEPVTEIDCSTLPEFDAVDELRLLNNIIKHAGAVADAKLASKYPHWQANEKLFDLDKAYARLKPLIKQYMRAFVNEAYDKSTAFGPK